MPDLPTVFKRLTGLLEDNQIPFKVLEHDPVYTSEEAARVRGTSLSSGAKALICKIDSHFVMFVMPADLKLASKGARKLAEGRNLRFAQLDEVLELTGLRPGSIPPFGSIFEMQTYCDERLANEATINFNAGDHSKSLEMNYSDYQRFEQPIMGVIAKSS